jgi:formylglycine-generating enzyme required for sulfatase activity
LETKSSNSGSGIVRSAENASTQVNPNKPPAQVAPVANMLWVPPGTFRLGTPDDEPNGDAREKPQTQVTLTRGFWLGKCEVTQAEYEAMMGGNPSRFGSRPSDPVEYVSWDDCMEFCRRLTDRERQAGHLPADYAYRLPTEAEWEYTARAGTTSSWFFGTTVDSDTLKKFAWFQGNSSRTTHPVGVKQANPWGFYDMYGNVWEWCLDALQKYPSGSVVDLKGTSSGQFRATRGGCYGDGPNGCRSPRRSIRNATGRDASLGFRLALSVSPKSP